MEIVTYNPLCAEQLAAFMDAMWTSLGRKLKPEGIDSDIFTVEQTYQKPGGQFWIANNLKGEVVGSIGVLKLADNIGYIRRFYVLPQFQGLGIGSNLLDKALAFVREQGFQIVRLDTMHGFQKAQNMFLQAGFVQIANLPVTYAFGAVVNPEVVMELKL